MAYQHTGTQHVFDLPHRALGAIKSAFSWMWNGMIAISETNRRVKLVERLSAKSDRELEKLGIRREDIVRHVFRDMLDI